MENLILIPEIHQALQKLKTDFDIKKVFLFGSQAHGNSKSDSDYDLVLVVLESTLDVFERRVKARTLLTGLPNSYDVFIYTQNEFEILKNDFGSIVETAVSTGKEIEFR